MEIKKIRIGNDIRLAVDLRQYIDGNHLAEREVYNPEQTDFENIDSNPFVNKDYEVYYPNQYNTNGGTIEYSPQGTPISIRSIKAFLINTTRQEQYTENLRKKSRFIARFPIEPYIEAFHATPYNVCNSGYPTWRAYPRSYAVAPYHGFGVYPDWKSIYTPLPKINDIEYVAPVAATNKQHVVEVMFPAKHQLHTGIYKLVVVAKVYAPGFHKNLKTITVDMPNVFELVKTSDEGIDTGIMMTVQNTHDVLPGGEDTPEVVYDDIYVNDGSVADVDGSSTMVLGRTDGQPVNIDLSSIADWYEGD